MPWEALAFWSTIMFGPFIVAAVFIRLTREK